jgi:hypothetical protein
LDIGGSNGGGFRAGNPPEWVYTEIKAALIGFWFPGGPVSALAGAAVSSAVDAIIENLD